MYGEPGEPVFTPAPIHNERFIISPKTMADTFRAETMIIRMEDKACYEGVSFTLRHLLTRIEAISTIRIEGKPTDLKSLLLLESYLEGDMEGEKQKLNGLDSLDFEDEETRKTTLEIFHYLKALKYIYFDMDRDKPFTPQCLLDIHSLSLYGCLASVSGTGFRQRAFTLPTEMAAAKVYEPPDPKKLMSLIADLCDFINEEEYTPILQSAIAHFQFESLKPFKRGLDKTGRLMCHAIIRKRGLTQNVIAPIGLEPAIDTKSHAQSLLPYNFGLAVGSENRMRFIDKWAAYCARSAEVSAKAAAVYLSALLTLREHWVDIFGKPNKGSAPEALIDLLFGTPLLTVKQAVALTGKSVSSVNDAFARLERAGILSPSGNLQRSRVFVSQVALDLLDELDRKINPSEPVSRDSFITWINGQQ